VLETRSDPLSGGVNWANSFKKYALLAINYGNLDLLRHSALLIRCP